MKLFGNVIKLLLMVAVATTISSCSSGSTQLEEQENLNITVGGVEFTMVNVAGGTFTMGCTDKWCRVYNPVQEFVEYYFDIWRTDCSFQEHPAHQVTLSDYYIGETEVTQALWEAVMGDNPSYFKGDDLPVEQVSWNDCQEFILKLNAATGRSFRLPTEAEWEYAARGGNKSKGYKFQEVIE